MAQFPFRTAVAFLIQYNEKRDINMGDTENMFANIWPLLELFADSSASARCSCSLLVLAARACKLFAARISAV